MSRESAMGVRCTSKFWPEAHFCIQITGSLRMVLEGCCLRGYPRSYNLTFHSVDSLGARRLLPFMGDSVEKPRASPFCTVGSIGMMVGTPGHPHLTSVRLSFTQTWDQLGQSHCNLAVALRAAHRDCSPCPGRITVSMPFEVRCDHRLPLTNEMQEAVKSVTSHRASVILTSSFPLPL